MLHDRATLEIASQHAGCFRVAGAAAAAAGLGDHRQQGPRTALKVENKCLC